MRVILDYNKNMGAVDVTDQMLTAKLVEGKRKKVFHKNLCSVLLWCKQLIKRSYITEQVRNVLRMWKMQLVVHHDVMEEDDMDVKAEGADDEGGVRDRRGQRRSLEVGEGFQVVAKGSGKNSRQNARPAAAAAAEQVVFIRPRQAR